MCLCACASMMGTVRERAVVELDCPNESVEVSELPGSAFAASGCGRSASYACNRTYDGRSAYTGPVNCMREGAVQSAPVVQRRAPSAPPTSTTTGTSSTTFPERPERATVLHALSVASDLAQSCRRGPPVTIRVVVRFQSEGLTASVVVPPPYEHTAQGDCVARIVRAARISPFHAPFVEVTYPLALR